MADLRDRLEEYFAEMDALRRERDTWRDRYLTLVDEKDRREAVAVARGCVCCHARGAGEATPRATAGGGA